MWDLSQARGGGAHTNSIPNGSHNGIAVMLSHPELRAFFKASEIAASSASWLAAAAASGEIVMVISPVFDRTSAPNFSPPAWTSKRSTFSKPGLVSSSRATTIGAERP